jgi:hypothetical protein
MIQKGRTTALVVIENVNRSANVLLEFFFVEGCLSYECLKIEQIGNAGMHLAPCII